MNNQRFKTVCIMLALVLLVSCVALFLISTTADAAVIKQGSSGETVRKIQTKLKNWGYYTGSVDGIFGSKTLAASQVFSAQKRTCGGRHSGNKDSRRHGHQSFVVLGRNGQRHDKQQQSLSARLLHLRRGARRKLYRQSRHCGSRPQQSKKQQFPQHNQRGDISARRFLPPFPTVKSIWAPTTNVSEPRRTRLTAGTPHTDVFIITIPKRRPTNG